jgi:glutamine amidotransferase
MSNIAVVDYGIGNLLSVKRSLEYCGAKVTVTSSPEIIMNSEKVVLPGVGAFPVGMKSLQDYGLVEVIRNVARNRIPLLAICLGMQMLFEESEEFENTKGLGLIPGKVIQIPNTGPLNKPLKRPHIGWNSLTHPEILGNWEGSVLQDNHLGDSVYFVHSYMAKLANPENLLAEVQYGNHKIPAVVIKDKTIGCQFHPEKSGEIGLKILKSFNAK